MMNKRSLKKSINAICDEIFAEAVAVSLYGNNRNRENDEAMIRSIIALRADYVSRISHPEPGMKKQDFYKNLRDSFVERATEIMDQINA
ncbi:MULTISPECIES: hypothetical protein [unclassified Prevotella]|uniref:hypothetical protein n=1 Tax=unclassified Prevotella TaxID=2638335 RepID=UPI00048A548B|nr:MULTISPECIES: hypothetical protein [unclassified Prevotella]